MGLYFSEDEFKETLKFAIDKLSENKTSQKKPVAFLLGDQAGAGKTTLHAIIKDKLNNNVITIDDISLFTREGTKVYSSVETPSISPKEVISNALNEKASRDVLLNKIERIIIRPSKIIINYLNF